MTIPPPWIEGQLLGIDWVNGLKHRQHDARGEKNGGEDDEEDTFTLIHKHAETTHFHEAEDHHDDEGEEHGHHHHHAATTLQKLLRGHKHRKHAAQKKEERDTVRAHIHSTLKHTNSSDKLVKRRTSIRKRRSSSINVAAILTEEQIEHKIRDKLENLPTGMKPKTEEEEKKLHDQLHHFYADKNNAVVKARRVSMTAASNESIKMAEEYWNDHQKEVNEDHERKKEEDEKKLAKKEENEMSFSDFVDSGSGKKEEENDHVHDQKKRKKAQLLKDTPSSSDVTNPQHINAKAACCCVIS
jgi:hypothetical protein